MKRTISEVVVILLLVSMLTLTYNSQRAKCLEPPETEWSKTYGGTDDDSPRCVIQTSDGGYAIVGGTKSYGVGDYDLWVIKTDSTGLTEWNITYGGSGWDFGNCIINTSDGGYAIAGSTFSFGAGNEDIWLVKMNASGNIQWNQTYGGTAEENAGRDHSVIQTSDGGYMVVGNTWSFDEFGMSDLWMIKTNSTGHMEWNKVHGGSVREAAQSVIQTDDGGYALAGWTESFGAGSHTGDFWLVKTNSTGDMEWHERYGGASVDDLLSFGQTIDGGYALAGITDSFGAGNEDFWLVKTNSSGHMEWSKTYGEAGVDYCRSVVATSDGGFALAGYKDSSSTDGRDFWLVKTDATGTEQWNETYGGANDEEVWSVIQTSDGGYAMTGMTNSFGAGSYDFWLIKLAPTTITTIIDIDPNTLNLRSKDKWITCYVELPEDYDVTDIDVSTIMLNDSIPAQIHPTCINDEDGDGIPDLMVKFDRAEVRSYIIANVNMTKLYEERFMTITLTITGKLYDETQFQGSDTIRVIMHLPRGLRKLLSHPIPF